jgi:hypothetical protein
MSKLSIKGAVDHLKTMYGDIELDYVDIETVYRNTGLNQSVRKERDKLYNRLSGMRHLDLVAKEYETRGGTKNLKGLRLTPKGVLAVHGETASDQAHPALEDRTEILARWQADAEKLKVLYPEFEVIYDMRLRKA